MDCRRSSVDGSEKSTEVSDVHDKVDEIPPSLPAVSVTSSIDKICARLRHQGNGEQSCWKPQTKMREGEMVPYSDGQEQQQNYEDHLTEESLSHEHNVDGGEAHSVIVVKTEAEEMLGVKEENMAHESEQQQTASSDVVNTACHKLKARNTTHYNSWHYTDMIQAIKDVQTKLLSMTAAAKKYGIPRTTLRHYLNDGTNKEAKRAGFFLPKDQEMALVDYALQHSSLTEKQLYKCIFDRAKDLSCVFVPSSIGGDDRKIVPTPAWIRRFVYRQKRLHKLFPTLLNKFEHPLHGGRKSCTDNEFASYDNNKVNGNGTSCEVGRLMENSKRRMSTEIIFPNKRSPDSYHPYDVACSPQEPAEFSSHSPMSMQSKSRSHSEGYASSETSPTRKNFFPSTSTIPHYSSTNGNKDTLFEHLVGEIGGATISKKVDIDTRERKPWFFAEAGNKQQQQQRRSNYVVESRREVSPEHFYNTDAYQRVIPTSQFTNYEEKDKLMNGHMSREGRFPKPYNDRGPTLGKTNGVVPRRTSPLGLTDEYNISRQNPVHTNEFELNVMTRNVMTTTLEAMENELGKDYVHLFSERYSRNRKLERLYCKWGTLKSEIEKLEGNSRSPSHDP